MIIDAHLDLAFNAVNLSADLELSLDQLRASPHGQRMRDRGETPTVSLPALRDADARIVFGTIFVLPATSHFDPPGPIYTTPDEANVQGWAHLHYYQSLADRGAITLIGSQTDLDPLLQSPHLQSPALGLVPLMEGADPIRDPAELEHWFAAGLRIVGPAWSATRYSGGTHAPGPLTPAGRDLMPALDRHGFALDTSHLAEESFWEALRLFRGSVIASHSNCRAFVPTDRHLSDDMIRAIVDRDGVIGVVLGNPFLHADWKEGDPKNTVTLADVVRHVDHICAVAGSARHVGIGSDLDGGFGVEAIPAELDSCCDLDLIGAALRVAGWRAAEIDGVLHGNWTRWLRSALPA